MLYLLLFLIPNAKKLCVPVRQFTGLTVSNQGPDIHFNNQQSNASLLLCINNIVDSYKWQLQQGLH
jgi:hypothetical protein